MKMGTNNQNFKINPEKIRGYMQRIFAPKPVATGLAICYFVSLIPLVVLSWYNYPSADDYTNGSQCYHVWQAGHSIPGVVAAALQRTVQEWFAWRGCFTSAFLSAMPPNIYGEGWYKITTWLVTGMLTASVAYFLYMLLVRVFRADFCSASSIIMLTLLVSVQCIPGRVEVFYWYSGAINYTFMYGVSLFFYGSLIAIAIGQGKRRKVDIVVSSILGFLVSGANQMTMLNAAIILFAILLSITCRKKWSEYKALTIPVIVFYLGFALAIAAPGNFVRAGEASGMSPVKAIMVSLYYCLDIVINEWLTWPVILAAIAMVPLFWHICTATKFKFPYPLPVVLSGYCLVSAMMTPPLFAVGNIGSGRTQGQIFLMFILVLTLSVGYLTGWARKKYEYIKNQLESLEIKTEHACRNGEGYGAEASLCLAGSLIFLIFGVILTLIPNPGYFTSVSAAVDYVNGSAHAYGEALSARAALYRASPGEWVEVEALEEQPELLFFSDITEDGEDWTNRGVARFYDLAGVVLKTKQ